MLRCKVRPRCRLPWFTWFAASPVCLGLMNRDARWRPGGVAVSAGHSSLARPPRDTCGATFRYVASCHGLPKLWMVPSLTS